MSDWCLRTRKRGSRRSSREGSFPGSGRQIRSSVWPVQVGHGRIRVLRLCSVKSVDGAQIENGANSIARTRCQETQCSLFPIYSRLPKLDVAGSILVSPSKKSVTWGRPSSKPLVLRLAHLYTLPADCASGALSCPLERLRPGRLPAVRIFLLGLFIGNRPGNSARR